METLTLRRMQEPSRVERLLDSYIAHGGELPDNCYQVRDSSNLPHALRTILARAIEQGEAWACRARGSQPWLFTCHMSLERSRERGGPVLLVRLYGEEGALLDSGAFRFDPEGKWTRCID